MIIEITNDVYVLDEGTYTAVIAEIFFYGDDEQVCIKFNLEDDDNTTFVYFAFSDRLCGHPWNSLFKALKSNDTDDLLGKKVEFEIKNKSGKDTERIFSNITKIKLI